MGDPGSQNFWSPEFNKKWRRISKNVCIEMNINIKIAKKIVS